MSEVPLEYKVMKKKVSKSLQKAIGDDLVGIIVYGGAASDRVFSGVSDVDFFIILKTGEDAERDLSENYAILGDEILSFYDNPLFASLLDYEIYVEDELPTSGDNLKGFSAIRALSLADGETLVGSNPFEGFEVSQKDLIDSARLMVHDYLEKLTNLLFIPRFEQVLEDEEGEPRTEEEESMEAEKEFLAIDAILSSAQAYQMVTRKEYVCMPDVVLYGETEPIDGLDNELIQAAGLLNQGVESDVDNLFDRAINFCGSVYKMFNELE